MGPAVEPAERLAGIEPTGEAKGVTRRTLAATALAIGGLGFLAALLDIAAKPLTFDELFDGIAVRRSWSGLVSLISETEASQALAALVAIVVLAFAVYERIEHRNRDVTTNWHDAAACLDAVAGADDEVIVLPQWVRPAMEFYAPDIPYRVRIESGARTAYLSAGCGDADGLVRKIVQGTGAKRVGPVAEFGRDLCVYAFMLRRPG